MVHPVYRNGGFGTPGCGERTRSSLPYGGGEWDVVVAI
jgi:hypothetical protein